MDGKLPPLERIEDMAALYVSAIRDIQPHGPYLLGGYSGGGGLEWALTHNIFARADYEYIQWSPIQKISSHLNVAHVGLGVRF